MNDFDNEMVSVIMPAYNAVGTMRESVESVQAQEYQKWELLVVDDGSTDATAEIMDQFEKDDFRVKRISLKENIGISGARNVGIVNARGRYLAFLDSDDLWNPKKLSKQIEFMNNGGYAFTFTSYELMNQDGMLLHKKVRAKKSVTYRSLLTNNYIGCLTVMIDRKAIPHVMMPAVRHEDYAAWLNILKTGVKAYGLDEILSIYRISDSSISANKIKVIGWFWTIYREDQKIGRLRALFLMVINLTKLAIKYTRTGRIVGIFKKRG